jgi:DNA-binding response OmpR family regulator
MSGPTCLTGYSILIIEGDSHSAADMSDRLVALGAKVQVASDLSSGEILIRNMRWDMVLVGVNASPEPSKGTLDRYGLPRIQFATAAATVH